MGAIRKLQAGADSDPIDVRLAAYLAAAGAIGTTLVSSAEAAIVGNSIVQPVGINGSASIDFNSDGQVDFEIDHDQVDLGGGNVVDYLQLDKNDFNGASFGENLLPIDANDTFPLNSTVGNDAIESGYVTPNGFDTDYPAALVAGTPIGPASTFTFQESDAYAFSKTIRSNRLIDEDAGQADMILGGKTLAQLQAPTNGPNFLGLGGEVRYLGVKMDLNNTNQINYGWIGVQITSDADATANVVGYAYETIPGVPIAAGAPEPGTLIGMLVGGGVLLGRLLGRRRSRN